VQAFAKARSDGNLLVKTSRASDRAIATANIPAVCKSALRTPASAYRYYRRLDAVLKRFIAALRAQSPVRSRSAAAALKALDDGGVPSAEESLARFRAGCR
jgi:hypothetical protein